MLKTICDKKKSNRWYCGKKRKNITSS